MRPTATSVRIDDLATLFWRKKVPQMRDTSIFKNVRTAKELAEVAPLGRLIAKYRNQFGQIKWLAAGQLQECSLPHHLVCKKRAGSATLLLGDQNWPRSAHGIAVERV